MAVTAIVGANWGDEGKGKTTDYLASESDIVVRFQGGNNAGHTVINNYGKFVLHLLPSGVFHKNVINVLGPGVALNIQSFIKEKNELIARGVPEPELKISERIQVVLPFHILFDKLEEERLADKKFGSTKSGIAPFYSDKFLKLGVQVSDLFDKDILTKRLQTSLVAKNVLLKHLYMKPLVSIDSIISTLMHDRELIRPYISDTTKFLYDALLENKRILVEGQLGALRDPDHGLYPYPTSSSTLAGYATVGAGIPPYSIRRIIAVVKSYSSCVGAGPFVTEMEEKSGDILREKGGDAGEYGATTGRPRRMGWFDVVATSYGCRIQGATEIALTNLDVLGYLEEINLCIAYEINRNKTEDFPVPGKLEKAKPVYIKLKGWECNISNIRNFNDLPHNAKEYVKFIEDSCGIPVKWISVGPRREEMIRK